MIVLKFGGTSVGGPDQIRRVCGIIRNCLERKPVVVSSAVGGVTNRLFKIVDKAVRRGDWEGELEGLRAVHRDILADLELDPELVDPLLEELHDLMRGIRLIGECTPRVSDYAVSFGERIAVRILSAYLATTGVAARAFDAFDVGLVTDSRFGAARPLEDVDERIAKALSGVEEVPVITGYIGKDQRGDITTLGRGGSDYSAAIFGAALDAEEIQIWTDVDGVMTADPRIVKEARFLEKLSFAEAAELAYYGAKVIHPATMVPAVRKNVPLRILNSYRPEFEGTVIVNRLEPHERQVKSIASKDRVCIINIVAAPMFLQYGFIERIADVFARHEVMIDMIATSEVSVSMTTSPEARLDPVVEELARFADVTVTKEMSQVSLVGEEISDRIGFAASVFRVIADLGLNVKMISFGATRNNLSFVIPCERIAEVVIALHQKIFS